MFHICPVVSRLCPSTLYNMVQAFWRCQLIQNESINQKKSTHMSNNASAEESLFVCYIAFDRRFDSIIVLSSFFVLLLCVCVFPPEVILICIVAHNKMYTFLHLLNWIVDCITAHWKKKRIILITHCAMAFS